LKNNDFLGQLDENNDLKELNLSHKKTPLKISGS
jgi:hypothetical protein